MCIKESENCGLFGWSNTSIMNSVSSSSPSSQSNSDGGLFDSAKKNSNSSLFIDTSSAKANIGEMFANFFDNLEPQPTSGTQDKFEPMLGSDTCPKGWTYNTEIYCYSKMPKYQRN